MINIDKLNPLIIERLLPLKPDKIILFGSYVYGEPTIDSDLDILVIKNSYHNKWEEKSKIRKALKDIRISKDILVENEKFFLTHSTENWINTALYDAMHKGEVLYG